MHNILSRLQKFIIPRRRAVFLLVAVVILAGVLGVGHWVWGAGPVGTAVDTVFKLLAWVVLAIISLVGKLLVVIVGILIAVCKYNGFIYSNAVTVGWIVCRDICNMFFVLILLYNAFTLVLGGLGYPGKGDPMKNILKIVIAAIIINFSKLICGLIIDVSQVFMMLFVSAFADNLAGNFATALGLKEMVEFSDVAIKNTPSSSGTGYGPILIAAILAGIALVIATVVVCIMAIILMLRVIYLWFLIILSPFAWLASVAPVPQIQSFNGIWWKKFSAQVIVGPLMAFFLWLSLTIMANNSKLSDTFTDSSGNKLTSVSGLSSTATIDTTGADLGGSGMTAAISEFGKWDNIFSFVIAIILLVLSLTQAQQLGVAGGAIAGSWATKIKSKPQELGKWGKGVYDRRIDLGGRAQEGLGKGAAALRKTSFGKSLAQNKILGGTYQSWSGQLKAAGEQRRLKRLKALMATGKNSRFAGEDVDYLKKNEDIKGMNEMNKYLFGKALVAAGEIRKLKKGEEDKMFELLRSAKMAKEQKLEGDVSKANWKAMLGQTNKDTTRIMIKTDYLKNKDVVKDEDDLADIWQRAVANHIEGEITPEAMNILFPGIVLAERIGSTDAGTTASVFSKIKPQQRKDMTQEVFVDENGVSHTGISKMKKMNEQIKRDDKGKKVLDASGNAVMETIWTDDNTINMAKEYIDQNAFDYFNDDDKQEIFTALTNSFKIGDLSSREITSMIGKLEEKDQLKFVESDEFDLFYGNGKDLVADKNSQQVLISFIQSLKKEGTLSRISDSAKLQKILNTSANLEKNGDVSKGTVGGLIGGLSGNQIAMLDLNTLIDGFDVGTKEDDAFSVLNIAKNLSASKDGIKNMDKGTIAKLAEKLIEGRSHNKNWKEDATKLLSGNVEALGNLSSVSNVIRRALLAAGFSESQIDQLALDAYKQADKTNMSRASVEDVITTQNKKLVKYIKENTYEPAPASSDRYSAELTDALAKELTDWKKKKKSKMADIDPERQKATAELQQKYGDDYMNSGEYDSGKHYSLDAFRENIRTKESLENWETRGGDLSKTTVLTSEKSNKRPIIATSFDSEVGQAFGLDERDGGFSLSGAAWEDMKKDEEKKKAIIEGLKKQKIADSEIDKIMEAKSVSFINKAREGVDAKYLFVHEDIHAELEEMEEKNHGTINEIWNKIDEEKRSALLEKVRDFWGNSISEEQAIKEALVDGFSNSTQWKRADGIVLDKEIIDTMKEKGVDFKRFKNGNEPIEGFSELNEDEEGSEVESGMERLKNISEARNGQSNTNQSIQTDQKINQETAFSTKAPASEAISQGQQSVNQVLSENLERLGMSLDGLTEMLENSNQNTNKLGETLGDLEESLKNNTQLISPEAEETVKLLGEIKEGLKKKETGEEDENDTESLQNNLEKLHELLTGSQGELLETLKTYLKDGKTSQRDILNGLKFPIVKKVNLFESLFKEMLEISRGNVKSQKVVNKSIENMRNNLYDSGKQEAFNAAIIKLIDGLNKNNQSE